MSFGFSVGDFIAVVQLASRVVDGARRACGAHDELTRQVISLHVVLRRLEREIVKPRPASSIEDEERKAELAMLMEHCKKVLKVLEDILKKYNELSDPERMTTNFWKRVRFGNGEMLDLEKIRLELATHTNLMTMFLNLMSLDSLEKVEEYMIRHGEALRNLRTSVKWVTASMQTKAGYGEGSVLTDYTNDDKAFWKDLRRELVKEGYSSSVLTQSKAVIIDYIKELGDRGALDGLPDSSEYTMVDDTQDIDLDSTRESLEIGSRSIEGGLLKSDESCVKHETKDPELSSIHVPPYEKTAQFHQVQMTDEISVMRNQIRDFAKECQPMVLPRGAGYTWRLLMRITLRLDTHVINMTLNAVRERIFIIERATGKTPIWILVKPPCEETGLESLIAAVTLYWTVVGDLSSKKSKGRNILSKGLDVGKCSLEHWEVKLAVMLWIYWLEMIYILGRVKQFKARNKTRHGLEILEDFVTEGEELLECVEEFLELSPNDAHRVKEADPKTGQRICFLTLLYRISDLRPAIEDWIIDVHLWNVRFVARFAAVLNSDFREQLVR